MSEPTLFDLPNTPDQFGVLLSPSDLRKIDFSALEFSTARRAVIEYIKTYFPDDFNDFVSNNGIIMLVELLSYQTAILSLRSDINANEAFLPTAQSERAVSNHLALINQQIRPATPAIVDIQCTVANAVGADIRIPAGTDFSVEGEDGNAFNYEIFRSPDDLDSDIVIPANKQGIIAYGIEGRTISTEFTSNGEPSQTFVITNDNILREPLTVNVSIGNVSDDYTRTDTLLRHEANSLVYEPKFIEDQLLIRFGDDINGNIPPVGSTVTVTYRTGGGTSGRIGTGVIDESRQIVPEEPFKAAVSVRFRNPTPSIGGTDRETIEEAKKRAPRAFSTRDSAITSQDYTHIASTFAHPVFGSVSKAMAAVKTGLNANRVEVYALGEGPDNTPVTPNAGLKRSLANFLDERNVLTDSVVVLDGQIKPISLDINVTVSREADGSVIETRVRDAISTFFEIDNWDMGQPLFLSQVYKIINEIDGIVAVDVLEPADNILASGDLESDDNQVALNELITLGSLEIDFFYERIQD